MPAWTLKADAWYFPAFAPSHPPSPALPLQVIDVSAGRRLAELAPAAVPPLLAEGFDHQNVEACPDYLPRLKAFLSQLEAASARTGAEAAVAAGAAAILTSGSRVQRQGSAPAAGSGSRSGRQ